MQIESQKSLFSIDQNVHYLNCAYMSPLLKRVEEKGIDGIFKKRNPYKIRPDDFFSSADELRSLVAILINSSETSSIAMIPSVSYGMAVAANNLRFIKGQKIIIVSEEFPSNYYVWKRICNEQQLLLQIISPGDNLPKGKSWNDNILNAIDQNTALVAISQVHWADGTKFELEKISKRTKEVDSYLIIDGTQSVGAMDFDLKKINPDALVCAGYKWLMGPYSMGFAWYGERLLNGRPLEDNWIGRMGSHNFGNLIDYTDNYRKGAIRYDIGESGNFILLPMFIEAIKQVIKWGPEAIQQYCYSLTHEFISELRQLGFKIAENEYLCNHLFSVALPENAINKVQHELSNNNIYVSFRGSYLRISPHLYNDSSDIAALKNCLKSCI